MVRLLVVALFLFLILPTASFAESITVSLGATPVYPNPNQAVTFKARSSASKGEYVYMWKVNGSPLTQGVDLDTVTIISGSQGTETRVEVELVDDAGNLAGSDTYVMLPGSVDVVWEGKTYVPPFYRGKPHVTGDSPITLQAIPHLSEDGNEIPQNDLVYLWEVDGKSMKSLSGYAKSSITVQPTAFKKTTTVSVTVETRDGVYAVKGVAAIPITSPRIIIYEDKPLGGLQLHSAVPLNFIFTGEEMTFWAVPFFVVDPGAMTFAWTLNGKPFSLDVDNPSVATFRKTGQGAGTFPVGVSIEKSGRIFEKAAKTFNLSFE